MNVVVVLLSISAAFLCQGICGQRPTTCGCGWTNKGRLVGGQITQMNEYPWMAALYAPDVVLVACGATIVTRHHAITAAHCEPYIHHWKLVLLVGAHDSKPFFKQDGIRIAIDRIVVHPEYTKRGFFSDDIAMVVTKTAIPFSSTVGPVCMPTGTLYLDHNDVKAVGWGRVGSGQDPSRYLKAIDMKVVPHHACKKYWPQIIEPKSQLCALNDKHEGVCNGDSGGPWVWMDPETRRYTLVAVTSYAATTCSYPPPAVNVEVGAYISWIKQVIQASMPEGLCTRA